MKIQTVRAREILDSRGNPTVEAEVLLDTGEIGHAAVPSGASTGSHEAHELRDNDPQRYSGRGVRKAVEHIHTEISRGLIGMDADDQEAIDAALIKLDGTTTKERLGANAILAVSLATAKAAALSRELPLYMYVRELSRLKRAMTLPLPLANIVNGGKHAAGSTDIQEFMIMPVGAHTFSDALRMITEVYHALKATLTARGYSTTVGDEGGFAPAVKNGNREALELIAEAVEKSGYRLGSDIAFALDVASTELYANGAYTLVMEQKTIGANDLVALYRDLAAAFPIRSIEDGLSEDDWDGWKHMTEHMGASTQLVGDDLLVTNTERLRRAIDERAGNAILIKPNQVGTLTETIRAVDMAHEAGWRAIISHRSGETEDVTIAHLAVGLGTGQIKTGAPCRSERTAKYNELLRIEEMLGDTAVFTSL